MCDALRESLDDHHNKYGSVSADGNPLDSVPLAHRAMTGHGINTDPATPTKPQHTRFPFGLSSSSLPRPRGSASSLSLPEMVNSPYFRPFSPALTGKSAMASPLRSQSPLKSARASDSVADGDQITEWQAGFTIVNLFLGLCLLSYPYALSQGGLSSLICFLCICFALCFTGKLIVRCFNALPDGVEASYPMIGWLSFGRFGYHLICWGIVAELFGALCTNTIFLWRNVSYLLTPLGLSMDGVIAVCCCCSLPTVWILNFNDLSINSLLGCVCKIFTAVVVLVAFFVNLDAVESNVARKEIEAVPSSPQSLCLSLGIYIMSFSGHPCLPSIYRAMKRPQSFERMLECCFLVMAAAYTLISVAGYFTFGGATNVVITANLLSQNGVLSKSLIVLVSAGCFFQTSPLVAVMAEIPENNVLRLRSDSASKVRAFRTALFVFISAASYLAIDHLPLIEAMTGSLCTMIVSVICPALFYQKLVLGAPRDAKKHVLKPRATESPLQIFALDDDAAFDRWTKNGRDSWRRWALQLALYFYVVFGTLLGLYMFCSDIMNAIQQQ